MMLLILRPLKDRFLSLLASLEYKTEAIWRYITEHREKNLRKPIVALVKLATTDATANGVRRARLLRIGYNLLEKLRMKLA